MREFKRSIRVRELLREEISQIITTRLKDPAIAMTTVTRVRLSDDLKSAKVYVNVHGDEKVRESTLLGLGRASRFIRSVIGQRTALKYVPEIRFFYDDAIDYAQNIETILKKIHDDDAIGHDSIPE